MPLAEAGERLRRLGDAVGPHGVVFGEGVVDFARVYEVLGKAGYGSACCMELEGPVFDRRDPDDLAAKVFRCVAHLKSVGVA